jgi:hypothetical protein
MNKLPRTITGAEMMNLEGLQLPSGTVNIIHYTGDGFCARVGGRGGKEHTYRYDKSRGLFVKVTR